MDEFIRVGVDLGKGYFQIHALTATAAISRKLSRTKVRTFFARLAPCRVGMEACGSAHYWARELAAMGHEVVLMAPAYIKPYVKRGKNDALDAAAICEAMSRPDMRFVPVKSADQQAVLMLHKTRELLVKQRTMSVNAAPVGISRSSASSSPRASAASASCSSWPSATGLCRKRPERWPSCSPAISKGSIDRSTPRRKGSPPPTGEARRVSCSIGFPASAR